MSLPYMNFYHMDYLADTVELTTIEHGAYLLLMLAYWREGGLPDDDAKLRRITRMSQKEWRAARETLAGKFREGWRHKRLDAELERTKVRYEGHVAAGRRGGMASAASGRRGEASTPRLAE